MATTLPPLGACWRGTAMVLPLRVLTNCITPHIAMVDIVMTAATPI